MKKTLASVMLLMAAAMLSCCSDDDNNSPQPEPIQKSTKPMVSARLTPNVTWKCRPLREKSWYRWKA